MRAAPAIAVALLIAACSSLPAPPPAPPPGGAAIAQAATALIGTPYQFGGADAAGFDCSGLARYVHERAGVAIPRTAAEQQRAAHPVPLKQLQPGDLVFFRIRKRGIDHVVLERGEAMLAQESDTAEPNSVLQVVQPGYELNGRLLRPARVIVSKGRG